jgi:hypothetical protein
MATHTNAWKRIPIFGNEKNFTAKGANVVFIWIFLCHSPLIASVSCGSGTDEEQSEGGILRLIQIRFEAPSFETFSLRSQDKFMASILDLSRTGLLIFSRVFMC